MTALILARGVKPRHPCGCPLPQGQLVLSLLCKNTGMGFCSHRLSSMHVFAGWGQTESLMEIQGMMMYVVHRCFSPVLEGFQSQGYAVGGSSRSGLQVNLGWRVEFCYTLCLRLIHFGSPEVLAWAESWCATASRAPLSQGKWLWEGIWSERWVLSLR